MLYIHLEFNFLLIFVYILCNFPMGLLIFMKEKYDLNEDGLIEK